MIYDPRSRYDKVDGRGLGFIALHAVISVRLASCVFRLGLWKRL